MFYIKSETSTTKIVLPTNIYWNQTISSSVHSLTIRFVGPEESISQIKEIIEDYRKIPIEIGIKKERFNHCMLSSWGVNRNYSEYSWIYKKSSEEESNKFFISPQKIQSLLESKTLNVWIRSDAEK